MAGHNLTIQLQSGNQVDQITVSEEAVERLMPGTPQETIDTAKEFLMRGFISLVRSRKDALAEDWARDNITTQT